MPLTWKEIFSAVITLAKSKNTHNLMKEVAKGGAVTASFATGGFLLFGPIGAAVGAAVGSIASSINSSGKFKPLHQILMEDLSDKQKEELAKQVEAVVKDLKAEDEAQLVLLFEKNEKLSVKVMGVVTDYLRVNLNLQPVVQS